MSTIDVTEDTFQETVTQDGIVFVDAWADWCGPCKQFAPTYEKASEKHTDVTFAKLDTEANQQVARGLDIRACLLYTSPSPRDRQKSRMPSSA